MRPLRAFSIRAKLVAIVMLTTVPALVLAGLSLGIFEVISARRVLQRELQTMADIVGTNSTAPLAFRDPTTGQEVLGALVSQPTVLSACLYDDDRALFASYRRPGDPGSCPDHPAPDGARFGDGRFVLWQPVSLQGEHLGTLGIVAHLGELSRRLVIFSLVLATVLVACTLAALLFSTRLQRLVSVPILELAGTAKRVSEEHDYALRAPKRTEDEIGFAVDAFNQMLVRIQGADNALRDAEEKSRGQARLLRSILDNMGEGLVVCDATGSFTLWNPAASRILGQGPAEIAPPEWPHHFGLMARAGGAPISPEDLPLVRALRGELVTDREIYVQPPAGHDHWIAATARPMRDEGGRLTGALVVFRDVSERKRAEEQLRSLNATLEQRVAERTAAAEQRAQELQRSNQELEQFANVASHDLQEPLRAVASYTQLLEDRLGPQLDPETRVYMTHVVGAVTRMRSLIKDLLDYSRIGRRPLQIVTADTGAILKATLDDLSLALQENDAVVSHGPLPTASVDPVQLGRLFQNLIANALKFRREDAPRIEVNAVKREDEGDWLFSVRDNGIGIDPRHHERIFVIFQRLHGRARPGTGIGLAICRKIAERHGGKIWVESVLGQGATFYFTLPLRKAREP
jgi:signal transduction histidine kinase/HAMP domain-containing protein